MQQVAAIERAIAGLVHAAARTIRLRVQHHGLETAPLQLWVTSPDLLFAQPGKLQQRGCQVEVRADGVCSFPLRPAGDAGGQVHNRRLIESNRSLLLEPVGAVHLSVVSGEQNHGVLPQSLAIQRLQDRIELQVHQAHTIDQIVATLDPQVRAILGDVAIGSIYSVTVRHDAGRMLRKIVLEVLGKADIPLLVKPAEPLLGGLERAHASGGRHLDRVGQVEHDVVRVDQAAYQ